MLDISYGCLTNKGERSVNEDYIGVAITKQVVSFILCDGLGGHGNGDVASKFVVEQMKHSLEECRSIEESIMISQKALLKKQLDENAGNTMKTTLTCLSITDNNARFGHVGDSRIYYFEKAKYKLRSQDHSIPQMLVNRGDIREKDIRHHEDRSRLLRVMGTEWNEPKYQMVDHIPLTKNSSFLLCSDGFWELIDEKNMCKTLKKASDPDDWLKSMEEIIWKNGRGSNMDNYSAIAIFVR
mgnify:CR=1 FL=1